MPILQELGQVLGGDDLESATTIAAAARIHGYYVPPHIALALWIEANHGFYASWADGNTSGIATALLQGLRTTGRLCLENGMLGVEPPNKKPHRVCSACGRSFSGGEPFYASTDITPQVILCGECLGKSHIMTTAGAESAAPDLTLQDVERKRDVVWEDLATRLVHNTLPGFNVAIETGKRIRIGSLVEICFPNYPMEIGLTVHVAGGQLRAKCIRDLRSALQYLRDLLLNQDDILAARDRVFTAIKETPNVSAKDLVAATGLPKYKVALTISRCWEEISKMCELEISDTAYLPSTHSIDLGLIVSPQYTDTNGKTFKMYYCKKTAKVGGRNRVRA